MLQYLRTYQHYQQSINWHCKLDSINLKVKLTRIWYMLFISVYQFTDIAIYQFLLLLLLL